MKSRGSHVKIKRRIKYAVYLAAALAGAALVFYLNFRREANLEGIQARQALVREKFDADPRFRNITIGIDRGMMVSTVAGNVASGGDLQELRQILSKTPPFPGTYNWKIEVEIRATPNPAQAP